MLLLSIQSCQYVLDGYIPSISVVEPLSVPSALRIRPHINDLKKRVKELNKKGAIWKKELSKIKKALDKASMKISWLRSTIHQKNKTHSTKKARLATKSMKLSRLIKEATWGTAAK